MAKKGIKLGLTYFIALIASLFLFGFIGWVYIDMLMAEPDTGEDDIGSASVEYKPTAADSRTILAVVDYGSAQNEACFMLIRFLPQFSEAAFFPIPTDTIIAAGAGGTIGADDTPGAGGTIGADDTPGGSITNGTDNAGDGDSGDNTAEETFFTAYRGGSVIALRTAVKDTLGVDVDKYIIFNADSFGNFCDLFSNTTYTLTEDILTPAGTVITAGEVYLDRNTMRQVLTHAGFKGGEEERARRFCDIVTSMLNKELVASFVSLMDSTFSSIVNTGADTDISRFDFEDSFDPLRYTLENTDRFCRPIISSGTRSLSGNYILDPEFITALEVWFDI